MKKNVLYLMTGVSGSGKSTYAKKFSQKYNIAYVSRDEIRFSLLKENEPYFAHEREVFKLFTKSIDAALKNTGSCIADATHLSVASREKLFKNINTSNLEVILLCMNTSIETCLARNETREGLAKVPRSVIRNMYYSYEMPTLKENPLYITITYVNGDEEEYDLVNV